MFVNNCCPCGPLHRNSDRNESTRFRWKFPLDIMTVITRPGNVQATPIYSIKSRRQIIDEIADWVAKDGDPYAITLTPNSIHASHHVVREKLCRLAKALAHGPRGVPRTCGLRDMTIDRPRIVGFEERAVESYSGAPIRHFHGLIGLRSKAEFEFCQQFLEAYWVGVNAETTLTGRSFVLEDCSRHVNGSRGWLFYATKPDTFRTEKEPIFIG